MACNASPTPDIGVENSVDGAIIDSYWPTTPPVKNAKNITMKWSERAAPGEVAIADLVTYKADKATIFPPTGWALIRDDGGQHVRQTLYWRAVQANDPHEFAWSFSEPVDAQGTIILLADARLDAPVDGSSGNGRGVQGGSDMVAKSVKTTSDGALVLAFYANDFGGAGFNAPDFMGEIVEDETQLGGYWILGTYQKHKGPTPDAICHGGQGFDSVSAQVAIRRSAEATESR